MFYLVDILGIEKLLALPFHFIQNFEAFVRWIVKEISVFQL